MGLLAMLRQRGGWRCFFCFSTTPCFPSIHNELPLAARTSCHRRCGPMCRRRCVPDNHDELFDHIAQGLDREKFEHSGNSTSLPGYRQGSPSANALLQICRIQNGADPTRAPRGEQINGADPTRAPRGRQMVQTRLVHLEARKRCKPDSCTPRLCKRHTDCRR